MFYPSHAALVIESEEKMGTLRFFRPRPAKNAIIELGGPEALSPLQTVAIFEEVFDRDFEVSFVPEEALLNQKKAAQDSTQETYAGLMLQYADGDRIQMTKTLDTFSMQFKSVEDYAKHLLKTELATQL